MKDIYPKITQVVIEPTRVSVTYENGQTKHHHAKGLEDAYSIAKRAYKGEV